MSKKEQVRNTEQFKAKALASYPAGRHDYTESVYVASNKPILIRCLLHDMPFKQWPSNHYRGSNSCPWCPGPKGKLNKLDIKMVIKKAEEVHGKKKYDYSQAVKPKEGTKGKIWIGCCKCKQWFSMKIESHIYSGSNCTYCANEIRSHSNEKKAPLEVRNLALFHPHIAREMAPEYDPSSYAPTSQVEVMWVCARGLHPNYKKEISVRVTQGQGCPPCAKGNLSETNNLGNNPDAVAWWDHELNELTPADYTHCSAARVHFVCDCLDKKLLSKQHKFTMNIYSFNDGERCPYRAGKLVDESNSYLSYCPAAATYWDEANEIGPHQVTYGSGKLFWFKCTCEHRWKSSPNSMRNGVNCPKCCPVGFSDVAIRWLDSLGVADMIHAKSGGEYKIPDTRWRADGYSPSTNTIYEFHGSFWHGDPNTCDPDKINPFSGKTFGELHRRTIEREDAIRMLGYNLVVMWESDYVRGKK